MKMILHDWNDDECVRILGNLHTAGAPACRLFIVEHVIPDDGEPDFAALFDMHMMCWGTGRERTVAEYRQLLEASEIFFDPRAFRCRSGCRYSLRRAPPWRTG